MKIRYLIITILLGAASASGQDTAINPKQFGAIGDGISHKITPADITTRTTGARGNRRWIGTYAVGDEWDYVGLQEAIYAAFQNGTLRPNKENRKLNKPLHIPAGFYLVNKSPTMTEVQGGIVYGDGRLTTKINARAGVPAWVCNGLWFTQFTGIQWSGSVAHPDGSALYEVDGNWDKTHTQSVQGNTWKDCHWDGNFVCDPDFAMCRHRTNSQGSENLFLNCHFNNPKRTAFHNYTYNALQQTFIGGDFSQHITGIAISAGSANLYSVGFQAKKPDQIDKNGYDIIVANSADAHVSMSNCRSESAKMAQFHNGVVAELDSDFIDMAAPNGVWTANHAYTQGQIVQGITGGNGNGHLHIVFGAGTSGATEPAWTDSNNNASTIEIIDGAMNAGATILTTVGGFANLSSAIMVGRGVMVVGAGAGGTNLYGTCTSFTSGSSIELDTAASTTVFGARAIAGPKTTDNGVTWIHDEYAECRFNNPTTVRNCSFRWGYIIATNQKWPTVIEHSNFCRADPFFVAFGQTAPSESVAFPVMVTNGGKIVTENFLTLNGGFNSGVAAVRMAAPSQTASLASTGTISVKMDTAVYTVTPTGDITLNDLGTGVPGTKVTFVITTSGITSRSITFGTNFLSTGVLASGIAPAKVYTVTFVCKNSTTWVETSRTGPL